MEVKLRAGRYMIPVSMTRNGKRIEFKFPYQPTLKDEIKAMQGSKWNPDRKVWSIADTPRNDFQLKYLMGQDPYGRFEKPEVELTNVFRPLYDHQLDMIRFALTYHYCILACEMGTGKTLAAIETMERSGYSDFWYVGPKSALRAVDLEFDKWSFHGNVKMITYTGLVKILKTYDDEAPKFVVFDESSKIKTPGSQRSQAALHLADAIREEHGDAGYVIEMSGTPAPKSPVDWWHQCEVAWPGFIREGSINAFRNRLALWEFVDYPRIITWWDDASKCLICGEPEATHYATDHHWKASINEVKYLYKRMGGLVMVKFKRDCLDIPEIQYTTINVTPNPATLRTAQSITKGAARAIEALTLLRELSDGFQYSKKVTGTTMCLDCGGVGTVQVAGNDEPVKCGTCQGRCTVDIYARDIIEVECPKDVIFTDMLDQHDDCGRFIVWAGFTGTIDKLVRLALANKWDVLRVDGRAWRGFSKMGLRLEPKLLLRAFDRSDNEYDMLLNTYPKVVFIGHPKAGGMGLNLSASPTELFYSNDFSGEARTQAEQRFHRPSMDTNRGATVVDLMHLPTDKLVLDNLRKKRNLEVLSMGELRDAMQESVGD